MQFNSQPRHRLQFNAGVIDNGLGLRLSGNRTDPTMIMDSGNGAGVLHYSSLATLDLRLFANLQQCFMNKAWARVTLAFANVSMRTKKFSTASGRTSQIYQPAFLDPYGCTVSLSIRRLFQ